MIVRNYIIFLLLFLYGTQAIATIFNNPGNIEEGQKFAGETGKVYAGRFSEFDTPEMGLRAIFRDIRTKVKQFDGDVDKIITKFAPSHENNTSKYINRIKKVIGKNKKINNKNLKDVVKEIVAIESADNFKIIKYYLDNPNIINAAEELSFIDMPSNTTGITAKKLYYEGEYAKKVLDI
tara:strand:+ start:170 stop:706 length:537 start_codon:yes stop_codon:yes gene_type:complete